MHEFRIATQIVEQAKKAGAKRKLHFEVGELAEIEPREIMEALMNMTDWKVFVSPKKGKIFCDCSYSGPAKILDRGHGYCLYVCPKCGNKPKMVEGDKIKIKGVE